MRRCGIFLWMPKRHVFDFYNDKRYAFSVQLKNTCTCLFVMIWAESTNAYLRVRKVTFKNEMFLSFSFLFVSISLPDHLWFFSDELTGISNTIGIINLSKYEKWCMGTYFSHVSANKVVQFFFQSFFSRSRLHAFFIKKKRQKNGKVTDTRIHK
jgi:hypothetical protein